MDEVTSDWSKVVVQSAPECVGFRGRVIKLGEQVLIPAGASDPAGGTVVAILPTSWPCVGDTLLVADWSCLIQIAFTGCPMYALIKAKECE